MKLIEIGPPFGAASGELLIKTVESVGEEKATIMLGPGNWAVDRDFTIPTNITLTGPGVSGIGSKKGATLTLSGSLIGLQIFPEKSEAQAWWGVEQEREG